MMLVDGAKILIVDDLVSMRSALRQALAKLGFNDVLECGDGEAALATLESENVGLVISDWQMEPMDGLDLLQAIRRDTRLQRLPFILVSAEAGPQLHAEATAAGASLVLSKPFGAAALQAALAGLSA